MFCSLMYTCILFILFLSNSRTSRRLLRIPKRAHKSVGIHIHFSNSSSELWNSWFCLLREPYRKRKKIIIKEKYCRYIIHFILLCIASKHKLLLLLSRLYMIKKWFRRFSRYSIYPSPNLRLVQPPNVLIRRIFW